MDTRYKTALSGVVHKHNRARAYLRILAAVANSQQHNGLHNCPVGSSVHELANDSDRFLELLRSWNFWERELNHDTAGFVRAVRDFLPQAQSPYLYWGMTSSDLTDTADALIYQECVSVYIQGELQRLIRLLPERSAPENHIPARRRGRTHGQLAEPVPYFRFYQRAERNLGRVQYNLQSCMLPGKISGPVGEYNAACTPLVERAVMQSLGIEADELASQTVDRFYYAQAAMVLIQMVGICEQLATLHRLSAISGVDLFQEDFKAGRQKGSSIMPYKNNPMRSERICGLARVCRGYLSAILETSHTQWWERDLTNSSVERVAFWDLIQTAFYILTLTADVVDMGVWMPDPSYDPSSYNSAVDELIERQRRGEDPDMVYREIQERYGL